jgi:hypothetical protein
VVVANRVQFGERVPDLDLSVILHDHAADECAAVTAVEKQDDLRVWRSAMASRTKSAPSDVATVNCGSHGSVSTAARWSRHTLGGRPANVSAQPI